MTRRDKTKRVTKTKTDIFIIIQIIITIISDNNILIIMTVKKCLQAI